MEWTFLPTPVYEEAGQAVLLRCAEICQSVPTSLVRSSTRHRFRLPSFFANLPADASEQIALLQFTTYVVLLPKGRIHDELIAGKKYPYLTYSEDGKVKSRYVKPEELELVMAQVEQRLQRCDEFY